MVKQKLKIYDVLFWWHDEVIVLMIQYYQLVTLYGKYDYKKI